MNWLIGSIIFGIVQFVSMLAYSCVGTIPSDVNCTSKWVRRNNMTAAVPHGEPHPTASTLTECQKACELNPRCVAVDWISISGLRQCFLNTNLNRTHDSRSTFDQWDWEVGTHYEWDHYDLVSRCNITSGEWLDCNIAASELRITEPNRSRSRR